MEEERVLVTGAAGFIGRYTAREYHAKGYYVVGIGHGTLDSAEMKAWGVDAWHTADVTMDALRAYAIGASVIVHCAGGGSVGVSLTHPMEDFERTVWTTHYVLEYIRTYSPDTVLVYPSSAAVYGVQDRLPLSADMIPNPISPYGVHKKMVEELCKMYGSQYGVKSVLLRLFSVYGGGLQKQLLWDTCRKLDSGINAFWGTGEETRDWVHAADMARAMCLARDYATADCPVVNLASGKGVKIRDIVEHIFTAYGSKKIPHFGGQENIGNPAHYVADVKDLHNMGWSPKVSLQEGIESYVRWYKAHDTSSIFASSR